MAQSVEHILGKDEVTSSILVTSSKGIARSQDTVDGHFGILGNIFQTASFFAVFSERMRSVFMMRKIYFVFTKTPIYAIMVMPNKNKY